MDPDTCLGLCNERGGSVYRFGVITSSKNASQYTCLCATEIGKAKILTK